jgi:hypothetical protein
VEQAVELDPLDVLARTACRAGACVGDCHVAYAVAALSYSHTRISDKSLSLSTGFVM